MSNLQHFGGGNRALSTAVLAEGTTAAKFKTTATCNYTIGGLLYAKAATDDLSFTVVATPQAALTTCLYGVDVNAAGTVSTVKGTEILTAKLGAYGDVIPLPTAAVDSVCRIGYIKVTTGAATFTPNTTDLSAANITGAYYNVSGEVVDPNVFL